MEQEERDRFIESWGSLGILWGINRSMARIHALLMVSEEPVDADSISSALNISRGNTSMCLKELRNWGVINRVHVSGERRDLFVAEPDTWSMLFRIASGRKMREFDPALHALRHVLSESNLPENSAVYGRLSEIEKFMTTLNHVIEKFLASEKRSKMMLEFLMNMTPK
ncbi:MAG: transcriptional regulator [Candidatus Zixiibacteriota bacterium]